MNDKCEYCEYTYYSKKKDNMTYFYRFCVYCKTETMLGYYVDLTDIHLKNDAKLFKNEESCEESKVNDESTINKDCENGCKI